MKESDDTTTTTRGEDKTTERIVWGLFGLVALMLIAEIVLPSSAYVPQPGIAAAILTALTTVLLADKTGGG